MTAYVIDPKGNQTELPVLLSWDLWHGFCSPCDSFELSFVYGPTSFETLRQAVRLHCVHEEETVFTGVVDETALSADSSGCIAVLRGRGMQALLLDNEAENAEYAGASAEFILSRHVTPFNIETANGSTMQNVKADLSVKSGDSHWSVVRKYTEFCAGVKPRFDREGVLHLDGKRGGNQIDITSQTPMSAQSYIQDRYGVISEVTVKNRVLGTAETIANESFRAMGGSCRRVVNVPRKTSFDAMRHTGTYQLAQSAEEFRVCELTLPTLFAAFPGDMAVLRETPLGISGSFLVWSSRCWADGKSAGTVLKLVPAD